LQVLGYASVFQSIVVGRRLRMRWPRAPHPGLVRAICWRPVSLLRLQMSLFAMLLLAGVVLLRLGSGLLVESPA
jgi:hypothetical protein